MAFVRGRCSLYPVFLFERKYLMGALLLLNKRSGGKFTAEEENFVREIAETLGIALRNHYQLSQRRPITKFDYLLEHNLITRDELDAAIAESRRKGIDAETVLIDEYRVPKKR